MAEGVAKFKQTKVNSGRTLNHYQVLDDGQGIIWLESRELDFGSVRDIKYLDVLQFVFDQIPPGLKIRLHFRDSRDEPKQIIELEHEDGKCYPDISARYFSIRIFDVSPTVKWKLTQIDAYGGFDGGMFV